MKIERITFGKTIAMPGYNNDKPEIEATLEDGDTLESVLSALNKRLTDWHKAEYPHLYQEENKQPWMGPEVNAPRQTIEFRRVESIPIISEDKGDPDETLRLIQNAPTLEILKTFKVIASSDPSKVLYNAYYKRIGELSK